MLFRSAAEIQARSIAAEVGDRAESFAEAARPFSSCASAQQDGSLGQIRRGELVPQVQASLDALAERPTGRAPTRSRFGWHVLRLQRRIPGQTLPFDIVAPKIRDIPAARSWSLAAARYEIGRAHV